MFLRIATRVRLCAVFFTRYTPKTFCCCWLFFTRVQHRCRAENEGTLMCTNTQFVDRSGREITLQTCLHLVLPNISSTRQDVCGSH